MFPCIFGFKLVIPKASLILLLPCMAEAVLRAILEKSCREGYPTDTRYFLASIYHSFGITSPIPKPFTDSVAKFMKILRGDRGPSSWTTESSDLMKMLKTVRADYESKLASGAIVKGTRNGTFVKQEPSGRDGEAKKQMGRLAELEAENAQLNKTICRQNQLLFETMKKVEECDKEILSSGAKIAELEKSKSARVHRKRSLR